VAAIPQIISSIVSAFSNRGPDIKAAGKNLFENVKDGISSIADSIADTVSNTIKGWIQSIKNTVSSWKDAGSNLISGLWNGISDKAQWLYNQITGMGTTIVNKVKSLFGIASPSKVFAEIGGYMAEGLGEGWDQEMKEVQNDINEDLSFKASIEPTSVTAAANALNGVTFFIQESVDLGDTQLKEIISKYTIQQIGNETRAVKVAQGGFYGIH
jgi:phage-related protein